MLPVFSPLLPAASSEWTSWHRLCSEHLDGEHWMAVLICNLLLFFSRLISVHRHTSPDNCYKPVSSRALAVSSPNCSNRIRPVFSISSNQSRFYATRYNNLVFNFFISQTVIKKWCFSLACVFSLILLQKINHISYLAGLCFLSCLCLITTWHSQHFPLPSWIYAID